MKPQPKILNSKGEEIILNSRETKLANSLERKLNALGYEIPITTLTTIMKKITEQKFFEVAPADYLPLRVGLTVSKLAWSTWVETMRVLLQQMLALTVLLFKLSTGQNLSVGQSWILKWLLSLETGT